MAFTGAELIGAMTGSSVLSSIITAFVTRKKDSGDLATTLVQTLMARIEKLEAEQASERAECASKIAGLQRTVSQLTLKLEVLRTKAKVPSAEWEAIEAEFDAAPEQVAG